LGCASNRSAAVVPAIVVIVVVPLVALVPAIVVLLGPDRELQGLRVQVAQALGLLGIPLVEIPAIQAARDVGLVDLPVVEVRPQSPPSWVGTSGSESAFAISRASSVSLKSRTPMPDW